MALCDWQAEIRILSNRQRLYQHTAFPAVNVAIFVNKVIFSLFTAFNRVTIHCDNVIVTIPDRISMVFGNEVTKTTVFVFTKFVFKLYPFQA